MSWPMNAAAAPARACSRGACYRRSFPAPTCFVRAHRRRSHGCPRDDPDRTANQSERRAGDLAALLNQSSGEVGESCSVECCGRSVMGDAGDSVPAQQDYRAAVAGTADFRVTS